MVTMEEFWNLDREHTAKGRRGLDAAQLYHSKALSFGLATRVWRCHRDKDSCANNLTDEATINGPNSEENAKQFMAWVGPEPSQYLPFTGACLCPSLCWKAAFPCLLAVVLQPLAGLENDQTFFFLQAGTYAVCYCALRAGGAS